MFSEVLIISISLAGFEVLPVEVMRSSIFRNMTPCSLSASSSSRSNVSKKPELLSTGGDDVSASICLTLVSCLDNSSTLKLEAACVL
jgi:hypothetical protein